MLFPFRVLDGVPETSDARGAPNIKRPTANTELQTRRRQFFPRRRI